MQPNKTQFSHPNGQRMQFSKPNIFEVDLHDDSIRSRCAHYNSVRRLLISLERVSFGCPPPSLSLDSHHPHQIRCSTRIVFGSFCGAFAISLLVFLLWCDVPGGALR